MSAKIVHYIYLVFGVKAPMLLLNTTYITQTHLTVESHEKTVMPRTITYQLLELLPIRNEHIAK